FAFIRVHSRLSVWPLFFGLGFNFGNLSRRVVDFGRPLSLFAFIRVHSRLKCFAVAFAFQLPNYQITQLLNSSGGTSCQSSTTMNLIP
ncbi:MAG TPA: hypothetical protein VI685_28690, partial [Candidatus Angelobacter sp.]